jgi:hypothetical protein
MTEREEVTQGPHLVVENARTDKPTLTLNNGNKRLVGPVVTTKEEYSRMFASCVGLIPVPKQVSLAEGNGQSSYALAISNVGCVQDWLSCTHNRSMMARIKLWTTEESG